MADLKTKEFGVREGFQTITPMKSPNATPEIAKSVVGGAAAVGKSMAAESGRSSAKEFTGADQTLAGINKNVDLFEETLDNNVTDAMVKNGGTIDGRILEEVKDSTLDQLNLSARGLMQAVERGLISSTEAKARANIQLQRASDSLIGTLFKDEYRNAFLRVTGNPSGSPFFGVNPTPEFIQQELNNKMSQQAEAQFEGQVATYAKTFNTTPDQARLALVAKATAAQEAAKRETLSKEQGYSDEQRLRYLPNDLDAENSTVIEDITAAWLTGGGVDPNEVATIRSNIKMTKEDILGRFAEDGMGSAAYKKATEFADRWEKYQLEYVEAISEQKLTKDQAELLKNSMSKVMANEMPLVYAISQFNPQLAQALGLMDEQTRTQFVKRLGIDIEKITNIAKELDDVKSVFDPRAKARHDQYASVPPALSVGTGSSNVDVIETYKEEGGDVSDLNKAWKAAPAVSLRTLADNLSQQIRLGKTTAVELGVNIINSTSQKYRAMAEEYEVDGHEYKVTYPAERMRNRGLRQPKIDIPEDLPEDAQEILRQMYKAIEKTPSLWEDEFMDAGEAFQFVMNDGHKFEVPTDKQELVLTKRGWKPKKEAEEYRKQIESGVLAPEGDPVMEAVDAALGNDRRVDIDSGADKRPPEVTEGQDFVNRSNPVDRNIPSVEIDTNLQGDRPAPVEETPSGKEGDIYSRIRAEENSGKTISKYTKLDDGTVGEGNSIRGDTAYPYAFYVEGKGWEVDRGYGELIKSGLTEEEAKQLVYDTPAIPLKESEAISKEVVDKALKDVESKWEGLAPNQKEVLAEMLYQGGSNLDVSTDAWKNTRASLKRAIKSQSPEDWLNTQAHMLNSVWATVQTPERALRMVHRMYPDTPIEVLKSLQDRYKDKEKS